MLQHNSLSEQGQNQLSSIFSSLKLSQLLRTTGIRKSYGVSSFAVFHIIFQLVFQGRNLYRLLEGSRAELLPGKDVVYRFLNESRYNWRRFYQLLSLNYTTGSVNCPVISRLYSHNCGAKVELIKNNLLFK